MAAPSRIAVTAGYSYGVTGTAAIMKWCFLCIAAKAFLMPDDTTLLFMAGSVFPVVHGGVHVGRLWFFRKTGIPPEAQPGE
jgi:hypothetical protein